MENAAAGWAQDAKEVEANKLALVGDRAKELEGQAAAMMLAYRNLERLEDELAAAKKTYNALSTSIVPGLMDDLGVPLKIVTDVSGHAVTIYTDNTFDVYVLVADEERLKRWVRKIGQGEIIKKKKSWSIDPRSLKPLVRNFVEGPNGDKLPKFITISRGRVAKVKVPRKKKA